MIHIKEFIDRVSVMDSRHHRDLILSASQARMLRDEIAKLLADKVYSMKSEPETIKMEISGGKW